MKRINTASLTLTLVCQRLEAWRQRRPGRSRIPEPFWTDAIALAQVEGVSRVSRVLRLPYQRLKDRLSTASPSSAPVALPAFVELAVPATPNQSPECLVEMTHHAGAKMTIHFPAASSGDLLPLAEAFWHQGR
jgi:hypothetical protein